MTSAEAKDIRTRYAKALRKWISEQNWTGKPSLAIKMEIYAYLDDKMHL